MSGLQCESQHLESWSCSVCNTHLSKVGHSAEALQLQVESTGDMVKKQPQAAGQVLSWQEVRQEIHIVAQNKPPLDHQPTENPTIGTFRPKKCKLKIWIDPKKNIWWGHKYVWTCIEKSSLRAACADGRSNSEACCIVREEIWNKSSSSTDRRGKLPSPAICIGLGLWRTKYNNAGPSGWLGVTAELTGGGLLTTSRLTVRSRHRSKWRATCLSAACWSSSISASRQSVDLHPFSHSPEGGSRIQVENTHGKFGILFKQKVIASVLCSQHVGVTHSKSLCLAFWLMQYLGAWWVCCS